MTDVSRWDDATMLVVDDDEVFREQLSRALRRRGLVVHSAESYEAALQLADELTFDYAVLDLRLEGPSGIELLDALLERQPDCVVVILTGYGSIATAVDAVKRGAVNFVQKPADADDLLAAFVRGMSGVSDDADIDYAAPSLARLEWEHINRVLADTGGNVSEAARRLGLHRRTLQRKLNAHPPKD
jgi:two-component system response regulator RegA